MIKIKIESGKVLFFLIAIISFLASCGTEHESAINSLYLGGECYLEIQDTDSINSLLSGDFGIELWLAADTSHPIKDCAVLSFRNGNLDREIAIYQSAIDSSRIIVYVKNLKIFDGSIQNLNWLKSEFHYIALTRSGSNIKFYFDGREIISQTLTGLNLNVGSRKVLIGADYTLSSGLVVISHFWVGYLDEFRLWKRCLPGEEVAFKAHNPDKLLQSFSQVNLATLFGLWRFNSVQSNYLNDESANTLNLKLSGNQGNFKWTSRKAPIL